MPDWDEDGPELHKNLSELLKQIRDDSLQRVEITLNAIRHWHQESLKGLTLPDPLMAGRFRGERGLEDIEVRIGKHLGIPAADVGGALAEFEQTLTKVVTRLDALLPKESDLNADQLAAVIDACAWVHAEWVRIHPFANGNGRMARLLANSLAMRYGLPPFIRLRPRPDGGYAVAGELAMRGEWHHTASVFRQMLKETLKH